MIYAGEFSGTLLLRPDPDLNYSATQSVNIVVKQNGSILAIKKIENIDKIGQYFNIRYEYNNFIDPVYLIIKNLSKDDQFNRDNPIEFIEIKIDNLYNVKTLVMNGKIFKNNQLVDTGNFLYDTSELIYEFKLPIFQNLLTKI